MYANNNGKLHASKKKFPSSASFLHISQTLFGLCTTDPWCWTDAWNMCRQREETTTPVQMDRAAAKAAEPESAAHLSNRGSQDPPGAGGAVEWADVCLPFLLLTPSDLALFPLSSRLLEAEWVRWLQHCRSWKRRGCMLERERLTLVIYCSPLRQTLFVTLVGIWGSR